MTIPCFAIVVAVFPVDNTAATDAIRVTGFVEGEKSESTSYNNKPLGPPLETDILIVEGIAQAGKAFDACSAALPEPE